jgi:hypothetical protein
MGTWLSKFWHMILSWLSEMGSAHVVDDGLGNRDQALKVQARKGKVSP